MVSCRGDHVFPQRHVHVLQLQRQGGETQQAVGDTPFPNTVPSLCTSHCAEGMTEGSPERRELD